MFQPEICIGAGRAFSSLAWTLRDPARHFKLFYVEFTLKTKAWFGIRSKTQRSEGAILRSTTGSLWTRERYVTFMCSGIPSSTRQAS